MDKGKAVLLYILLENVYTLAIYSIKLFKREKELISNISHTWISC